MSANYQAHDKSQFYQSLRSDLGLRLKFLNSKRSSDLSLGEEHCLERADAAHRQFLRLLAAVEGKYTLNLIPTYDEAIPLDYFYYRVSHGKFQTFEGHGHLATATHYSDLLIFTDDVYFYYPSELTHVVWFNTHSPGRGLSHVCHSEYDSYWNP